jgi:hypothetical protein
LAKKNEGWTNEKIIKQLNELYEKHSNEFNSTFLRKNYSKLMNAVYRNFKSFQIAMTESGIDYKVSTHVRIDFENAKNFIEIESNSGCTLLSSRYKKANDTLEIKCQCGNLFHTNFGYFKYNNKQQCNDCGLKKNDKTFIRQMFEKFGDSIVANEKYKGNNIKIRFSCKKHGEFFTKPKLILNGTHGCFECYRESAKELHSKGDRCCSVCESKQKVQEFNNTNINYCGKHYHQMRTYGEILNRIRTDENEIVKYDDHAEIILTDINCKESGRALISIGKLDKVKGYKWYLMNTGYVSTRTTGKALLLHRLLTDAKDDFVIDHINRNRLDCRDDNLRECTQSENAMNSSLSKRNSSGTTGVWYCKRDKKWVAEIFVKGKKHCLGRSEDKHVAIDIRKKAEHEYFGMFAPMRSDAHD